MQQIFIAAICGVLLHQGSVGWIAIDNEIRNAGLPFLDELGGVEKFSENGIAIVSPTIENKVGFAQEVSILF